MSDAKKPPIVWEQTARGWRRARVQAPQPRSVHRARAADEGALSTELRRAAAEKVAELAVGAVASVVDRVGVVPVAIAVGVLLRSKRRR